LTYACGGWGIQQWHLGVGYSRIANNTVFNCNGGVFLGSGGSPPSDFNFVGNNIFVNNNFGLAESSSGTGTHQTYTNNLIWNNKSNFQIYSGVAPTNGVNADPLFVNYQANGSGDYHLQPTSPARSTGTSQNAPPFDFDGISRPQGAEYDIGAYQFVAVNPPAVNPPTALKAVAQ
jgi:hypothetical protein